ncbi:MAG TPA: oligosaccharide flippase family protein [Vicinamibacterales bacterium]
MSDSALGRNVVLSLTGQIAPALAGLAALPLLARHLAPAELGLLNIGWLVIGYFTLLDFGIGRAITQGVAAALAQREDRHAGELVWTAWLVVAALSLPLAVLLALAAPWLALHVLDVPPGLTGSTAVVLRLLALALPAFTLSSAARAVLEAHQRFDLVTLIRIPVGTLSYAGPALLLPWTGSALPMVVLVTAVRIAGLLAFVGACFAASPPMRHASVSRAAAARLMGQGAWMTLATLAGGLHAYIDRFVLGALVPIAVFAIYSVPQEAIWRFIVIPVAFSGVLYPVFSGQWITARSEVSSAYAVGIFALLIPLAAVALFAAAIAPEIMVAWLGPDMGPKTVVVTRWFLAGILINGVATLPFVLLQATGHARTTGLLQVYQLVPYVVALVLVTRAYGIEGAAAVWAARMGIDAVLLFGAARRVLATADLPVPRVLIMLLPVLAGFGACAWADAIVVRTVLALLANGAAAFAGWHALGSEERAGVWRLWTGIWRGRAAASGAG